MTCSRGFLFTTTLLFGSKRPPSGTNDTHKPPQVAPNDTPKPPQAVSTAPKSPQSSPNAGVLTPSEPATLTQAKFLSKNAPPTPETI